jgi:hypothetical protein
MGARQDVKPRTVSAFKPEHDASVAAREALTTFDGERVAADFVGQATRPVPRRLSPEPGTAPG